MPPGSIMPKDFSVKPKANPKWFELSSSDERQLPPRISVFVARLTTPVQAWAISGSKEDRRAGAQLSIKRVRALRPESDPGVSVKSLDVIWDRDEIDHAAPGNLGHAGITGLNCPKSARRSYRQQLADISEVRFI